MRVPIILTSLEELHQIAQRLAPLLRSQDVLLLKGDLGAGKTEFARSLIRFLTKNDQLDVPSPTFTLLQTYESPKGPLTHVDLYRLEDPLEARELGLQEAFFEGISFIEWPDRLPKEFYPHPLEIQLTLLDSKGTRQLILQSDESHWTERLKELL